MINNRQIWKNWIATLHSWGIHEIVATGPLNLIGAQLIYLGQPFINIFFPEENINAFAELLDNPVETKLFVESLRQGS